MGIALLILTGFIYWQWNSTPTLPKPPTPPTPEVKAKMAKRYKEDMAEAAKECKKNWDKDQNFYGTFGQCVVETYNSNERNEYEPDPPDPY